LIDEDGESIESGSAPVGILPPILLAATILAASVKKTGSISRSGLDMSDLLNDPDSNMPLNPRRPCSKLTSMSSLL
jgi:hypothetical protein